MPLMPDCRDCIDFERLRTALTEAAKTTLWPWADILKGQNALLDRQISEHSGRHCIRCVTGEDGND